MFAVVDLRVQDGEINDVARRKDDAGHHSAHRALHVHPCVKNAHQDGREEGGRRQAERKSDRLGHKSGRIDPEIACQEYRTAGRYPCGHQFVFLFDVRHEGSAHQVAGDGRRDHQQKARGGGKCRGEPPGRNQTHYPVRQPANLGVGQHNDIAVHIHFVEGRIGVQLYEPVGVLIFVLYKPGLLPVGHPLRYLIVGHVVNRLYQIHLGECGHGRGGGVEDGDEQQGVAGRHPRVAHLWHREKPDDHVWEPSRAHHQGHGYEKDINRGPRPRCVGRKAELRMQLVELVEQVGARIVGQCSPEAELRYHVVGHDDGDVDHRHHVGENEDAVLCHLGVGDAAHAAHHRVDEHDHHPDAHTHVDVHIQEAGEDDAHAPHLTRNVGEGDEDGAGHGHQPGGVRIIAVAHEIGHGELAELAQIGGQEQGEQYIAAGPAHQVDRTVAAHEGDDAGHGDEGCGRHPVGGGGHAVGQWRNARPRNVELAGGEGPRPQRDPDIHGEGEADNDEGPGLNIHSFSPNPRLRQIHGRVCPSTIHTER